MNSYSPYGANPRHSVMLSRHLEFQYKNGEFCDLELVAGKDEKSVFCHRNVVVGNSDYFRAMFSNGMKETNQNKVVVGEVHSDVLAPLIRYCYTGVIELLEETVHVTMQTAAMLQFNAVLPLCANFMGRHLKPSNCLGVANIANHLNFTTLSYDATKYAYENFLEVCKCKQFFELDVTDLKVLLESDDLAVECETDIFDIICSWVNFSVIERFSQFTLLLPVLRERLLPPAFFTNLVRIVCMNCEREEPLLAEAFRWYSLLDRPSQPASPRKWTNTNVLALASIHKKEGLFVESYCPKDNEWTTCGRVEVNGENFGAAFLQGKLIIVGDLEETSDKNRERCTVKCFDLETKETKTLAPLYIERSNLGVVVLDGFLYALGGSKGSVVLHSVERYDLSSNKWNFVTSMLTPRYAAAYAVLGGLIYALGGMYDSDHHQNTMESYDPKTNSWTPRANMLKARTHAKLIAGHGALYLIGGYSWDGVMCDSVDRYDPLTDTWTQICVLNGATTFNYAFVGQKLLAIKNHRFDYWDSLNGWETVINTYNHEKNTWTLSQGTRALRNLSVRSLVAIPKVF